MGYDKPNYTQTPNLLLDEHLPDMGHAECKVVLAICRMTFGWHKRADQISLSQLQDLTGLSRQGVLNGIEDAVERGVVRKDASVTPHRFWLVVNEADQDSQRTRPEVVNELDRSSQRSRPGVVNEVDQGGQQSRPEVVNELDPQKKTKQTSTKEREKESAPAREDPVDVLKELWSGVRPNNFQKEKIRTIVDDLDRWRSLLERYLMEDKQSKRAVAWALDDYQDGDDGTQSAQKRKQNGRTYSRREAIEIVSSEYGTNTTVDDVFEIVNRDPLTFQKK